MGLRRRLVGLCRCYRVIKDFNVHQNKFSFYFLKRLGPDVFFLFVFLMIKEGVLKTLNELVI